MYTIQATLAVFGGSDKRDLVELGLRTGDVDLGQPDLYLLDWPLDLRLGCEQDCQDGTPALMLVQCLQVKLLEASALWPGQMASRAA